MNQIKMGQFIKSCRKEKKLTQQELADLIGVSFKTISKWECGNGTPDTTLMLPLCKELDITVNELLSGEHIQQKDYQMKAEENLIDVLKERKDNKKKIIISVIVILITLISSITLILLSGFLELETSLRIGLIIIAIVVLVMGIGLCCYIDIDAGYYECPNCHERFVPTMGKYIMGDHTLTRRRLKCPKCGEIHLCKKRLSRK